MPVYIPSCTCMIQFTCACMCICTCICACTRVPVFVYVFVHMYLHTVRRFPVAHPCTMLHRYTRVRVWYTHIDVCAYVHVLAQRITQTCLVHICVYVYVFTFTFICIFTCIYHSCVSWSYVYLRVYIIHVFLDSRVHVMTNSHACGLFCRI